MVIAALGCRETWLLLCNRCFDADGWLLMIIQPLFWISINTWAWSMFKAGSRQSKHSSYAWISPTLKIQACLIGSAYCESQLVTTSLGFFMMNLESYVCNPLMPIIPPPLIAPPSSILQCTSFRVTLNPCSFLISNDVWPQQNCTLEPSKTKTILMDCKISGDGFT